MIRTVPERQVSRMQVKLWIQERFQEMEIRVCYHEQNAQVEETARRIHELLQFSVQVQDENGIRILPVADIIRIYAENQRLRVQSKAGLFYSQQKLYELEEQLSKSQFVRISRSEMVNIRCISKLDMDLTGTIKVILSDGTQTYTSRRCIPQLKQALGIGKTEKKGKGEARKGDDHV